VLQFTGDEFKTFIKNWLEVSGEYIPVLPEDDLFELLTDFLLKNNIKSVVLASAPLSPDVYKNLKDSVEILANFGHDSVSIDEAKDLCNRADAGISSADVFISATGSLVIVSDSVRDKMVSSLPEIHIVIATDTLVFKDQHEFLKNAPLNTAFCIITGPSRTADIEKTLILGAHGPKRVVVFGS